MYPYAERALSHPLRVADGDDERPINARGPRPRLHVAALIGLNIAASDGFISLGGKASHAFPNRDQGNNLDYARRKPDVCFEHEHAAFEHVNRARVRAESVNDLFESRLHMADDSRRMRRASIWI